MIDLLDAWLSRLALGILLMGAGLVVLGDQLGMATILGGGLAAIGAAASTSGLESIITRKEAFVPWSLSARSLGRFATLSAILWGMLFLVVGALGILAGTAVALYPGGLGAAVDWVLQGTLGWVALGILLGAVSFTLGIMRLLADLGPGSTSFGRRIQVLVWRLGGAAMMAAGLALAGGSLLVGVAPQTMASLAGRVGTLILSSLP